MAKQDSDVERPLRNAKTCELEFELKIRQGPRWQCQKCSTFADHSGHFPCYGCGERQYWTGSFVWNESHQKAKEWIERIAIRYDLNQRRLFGDS